MNSVRWLMGTTILAMVVGLNQIPSNAADDNKTNKDNGKSTTSSTEIPPSAFLGVMVEELHPAFASHLSGIGAKGQGLLVESVGTTSPAAKAGVKVHDILMTYDDQKLFSHDQLVKLVGSDKAGREISLGLIREGKTQTVKAQLGERTDGWNHHHGQYMGRPQDGRHGWSGGTRQGQRVSSEQAQSDTDDAVWNTFDSMTLKKLDKDRFRASVAYTDRDGKLKKHEYEGTREEIRTKIDADKDLMPNEREHLTRGLDLDDGGMPFFFGPGEPWFDF